MTADQYCRDLEAHLCRRNGGHLVRVVGPAFECVQRWFQMGIPFKVACQGIDRHVDRVSARGARRRPVRVEFCDADVQDAFDAWRRAVGLRASEIAPGDGDETAGEADEPRGRTSLPAHLERVIARLTALRTGPAVAASWSEALEDAVRRVDALQAPAKRARGEARDAVIAELGEIDRLLIDAASREASDDVRAQAAAEAAEELEPFRARLSEAEFRRALDRARIRALRARLGLPVVAFD